MITVSIGEKKDGHSLTVKGHAGFCPGNDIVCAGVSALVTTLGLRVQKEANDGALTSSYVRLNSGDSTVWYCGENRILDEIFQTITDGLEGIAGNYPDYIKIIFHLPEKEGACKKLPDYNKSRQMR